MPCCKIRKACAEWGGKMRSTKVIGLIVLLALVWVSASLGGNHEFRGNQAQINGHTYIQREQIFGLTGTDGRGRTNLQRMEKGLAPLGTDGEPVVLHHDQQKSEGARIEVTATEHRKIKHPLKESEIDRPEFQKERVAYWKERAKAFRAASACQIQKTSTAVYSEGTRQQPKTSTDYSGYTPARSNFSESPRKSYHDPREADRQTRRGNQGCCSWHGGIARCDESQGRYVCNDGVYSPTCRCERKEPAKDRGSDYHSGYPSTHSDFSKSNPKAHHESYGISNEEEKTVHVRGYTRKDGTKVKEHWRSAPGKGKNQEK